MDLSFIIFKLVNIHVFQGNVKFIPDETHGEQARIESQALLATIAKLLASTQDEVEKALCYRVVAARGEIVEKGHSVKEALYGRDAFAKVIILIIIIIIIIKIERYQDLAIEIGRMWRTQTKVVPVVEGALGAQHRLKHWLAILGVDQKRGNIIQQTALLGSANILRKVLSI